MKQGRKLLISFEGGDRCGKSTQITLLVKALKKQKVPVQVFREPGGTKFGEKVRELLLHRHDYHLSSFLEFQLFTAARRKLAEEVLVPFLCKGRGVLILDRFYDSTHVYQGLAGGLSMKRFGEYEKESRLGIVPDITFLFDMPVAEAARRRLGAQKDRMEQKPRAFHEKVRRGFLARASKELKRFVVVDAGLSIEDVHARILSVLRPLLGISRQGR